MDHNCKNFEVCGKITDTRLDLCSTCYWTFHEVLTFDHSVNECPICLELTSPNVKYQSCIHFTCIKCFKKRRNNKCPMCREDNHTFLQKVKQSPESYPNVTYFQRE
jgi:hypothetical protein